MRRISFITGLLFLLAQTACAENPAETAKTTLHNAQGEEVGTVTFREILPGITEGGVTLSLSVHGLPPGPHAFHIHSVGKCDPPDFASAGPHFNPYGKKHGVKNPEGHHAGDLPNVVVGPDGTGVTELTTRHVTFAPGVHSLFDVDGASVVIHANEDDERTDPAGNAGARIACGVITQ